MAIAITPALIKSFERRYVVDHRDPTVAVDLETYARGWNDHAALGRGSVSEKAQHPDDIAVDRFAVAMKAKLAKKRAEGRGGWSDQSQCTAAFLSQLLHGHVHKGDPVDVGNLAMMLHQRGDRITLSKAVPSAGSQPVTNAQPYGYLDCFGIFYRYKAFANMTPVYTSAVAAQRGAGGDHE
ncbi:hypothetical protein [Achromobacter xylosoxidans]|uniref:hypothetical protein n=1 Tax=Alcaligenes xylosoxydans xylosoxydans TaxID=85698 RepID=UPI0024483C0D|nr:hypothetical protein [Achromobacter xylosoxidans]MDH0520605.1 hypothetical protein [Achromobacter xylosoxidans]MDH0547358.1 hypothetical protein [Achromobacter xylosoxidans]